MVSGFVNQSQFLLEDGRFLGMDRCHDVQTFGVATEAWKTMTNGHGALASTLCLLVL